jgi:L-aminopeptidase/D-esterase-like protein
VSKGIQGLRIGQITDYHHRTGCTVVLADEGAVAGVDVRGGAPGTHGTDALRPENLVDRLHAVVLTGGSAFGLAAVHGVMRYLRERNRGFVTGYGVVPIVTGAVVFDLGLNRSEHLPDAEMGYQACLTVSPEVEVQGCVGAGAGATVGKLFGLARAMKGGQGFASLATRYGLKLWALAVVNAFGDVRDPDTGRLLAGVRTEDGTGLADTTVCLSGMERLGGFISQNTVLGVVATNATLDRAQATRVAQMAHDGIARAVIPAHTLYDGDTVFALCTGGLTDVEVTVVGALAAQLLAQAIVNAIRHAVGVEGLPAARDL